MGRQQESKYFRREESEIDSGINLPALSSNSKIDLSSFLYSPDPMPRLSIQQNLQRYLPTSSTPRPSSLNLKRKVHTNSSTSAESASTTTKKSGNRGSTRYAPPSRYANFPPLPDVLVPNLLCLFVGLNPGLQTSRHGHAYSHPSNLFWKLLYSSGCTTHLVKPKDDGRLPEWFSIGNTNIVARPTRNGIELSKEEIDEGVSVLEEKVRTYRPEAVALVGKSIWKSVWRVKEGKGITGDQFKYGWQGEEHNMGRIEGKDSWGGARVFVACSTSGLAAALSPVQKRKIWRELGVWIEARREEKIHIK